MTWINIKDKEPPKNHAFIVLTTDDCIDIMTWRSNIQRDGKDMGWFTQHSSFCCCCSGHCSFEFDWWQELPR